RPRPRRRTPGSRKVPSQNPIPARDAELLPTEKDLDNIVWQGRMLELEYQLKLERWSAWRRSKRPGFRSFDSSRRGAGQLAVGRGSVGRPTGRHRWGD